MHKTFFKIFTATLITTTSLSAYAASMAEEYQRVSDQPAHSQQATLTHQNTQSNIQPYDAYEKPSAHGSVTEAKPSFFPDSIFEITNFIRKHPFQFVSGLGILGIIHPGFIETGLQNGLKSIAIGAKGGQIFFKSLAGACKLIPWEISQSLGNGADVLSECFGCFTHIGS